MSLNDACTHTQVTHRHGTRACYVHDKCRCPDCRQAGADYGRERARRLAEEAYGARSSRYVDADPVRQHLHALSRQGMGWKRAAAAAGVSTSTVCGILYGFPGRAPRRRIARHTAEALLAVTYHPTATTIVDGIGTRRRLQALVAIGWTQSSLATQLGMSPSNFGRLIAGEAPVIHATTTAVRALYDRTWSTPPVADNATQRGVANRSRRYAAKRGWLPPLAWDDDLIDDPDAVSDITALRPTKQSRQRTTEQLLEDALDLVDAGESWAMVARRLDISLEGIIAAHRRAGIPVRPELRAAIEAERSHRRRNAS